MPERCATAVRPPRVRLTCAQIESGEDDPRSHHQLGGVVVCPEMQEEPRLLIQHVPVQSGHLDAVGTQRLEHRVHLFRPRGEVSDDRLTLAPIPVPRGDVVGWQRTAPMIIGEPASGAGARCASTTSGALAVSIAA